MREILFRGKPKNKADYQLFSRTWKENCIDGFVYGSLIVSQDRYYICVSALCMASSLVNNGLTTMIEVIPETVGQYTGLTDKNGKKIFEGDIVCWCRIKGTIVWEEHKIYIKSNLLWDFSHDDIIEVIGNIHDNPELLKGGADNGHP